MFVALALPKFGGKMVCPADVISVRECGNELLTTQIGCFWPAHFSIDRLGDFLIVHIPESRGELAGF